MESGAVLMKRMSIAACLGATLAVAGCASTGNTSIRRETAETIDQKIHDDQTTQQQVRTLFGDPMVISFTDGGHEIWQYDFMTTRPNGTNFIPYYGVFSSGSRGMRKSLTIIFNNGIVWHHTLSASAVRTHQGL
ncbi:lipoprotein [Komagataeibacter intermedius NRIC 0521]|nr:lipoprotein [Komagataeibacter intermedius NRIC 0521]